MEKEAQITVVEEAGSRGEVRERGRRMLLCLILFAGLTMCLVSFASSGHCLIAAWLMGGFTILLCTLTEGRTRAFHWGKLLLYAICGLGLVLSIGSVVQGFLWEVNRLIILWNARFQTELERFVLGSSAEAGTVVLWGLMAVPVALFLWSVVRRRKVGGLLILFLMAAFLGTVVGTTEILSGVCIAFLGLAGYFLYDSTPRRRIGLLEIVNLVMTIVVLGISFPLTAGYKGQTTLAEIKESIAKGAEKLRFGEDTLPEGDFEKASELLKGEKERLTVILSTTPRELYLRGFVGSALTDEGWEALKIEAYEGKYEGILSWLKQEGFSAMTQYSWYDSLTKELEGKKSAATEVTVQNKGANRKYVYLPFSAVRWGQAGAKEKRDWQVQASDVFGAYSYTFEMTEQAPMAETAVPADWLNQEQTGEAGVYQNAENVYHSFVEDTYLTLSDDSKQEIREMFFPQDEDAELDFGEVTTLIRQVLREQTYYGKEPASPREGAFLEDFLKGHRSGNAVAYASAAVLAYRAAGYPARYVEGYHLSRTEAQAMTESGENTAVLTTQNAHAWAEVYVNGMGWLPVEVVPGMYVETYSSETIEGKPLFRVNASAVEDPSAEEGGSRSEEGMTGTAPGASYSLGGSLKRLFAVLLLLLYVLFFLGLLLELERFLRLLFREKKVKARLKKKGQKPEDDLPDYVGQLQWYMAHRGMNVKIRELKDTHEQFLAAFPDVEEAELDRAVTLLEKARFGRKNLKDYEKTTLEAFCQKVKECYYQESGFFKRMGARYLWLR